MPNNSISGSVFVAAFCIPLKGVWVQQLGARGVLISETKTDSSGRWELSVASESLIIRFFYEGYVEKLYECEDVHLIVRLLRDQLIGYQEKLWFHPGDKVSVFIHAPNVYSAGLYRHGLDKICVLALGKFPPIKQQMEDGYFVEKGLAWIQTFTYTIPVDVRPGIFNLQLVAENNDSFSIPMVISTPPKHWGKTARLLVLSSTNTWQSYNIWGGRSRYRNFENGVGYKRAQKKRRTKDFFPFWLEWLWASLMQFWWKAPDWMHRKLTIRRPFLNCALEQENVYEPFTNQFAGCEWRLFGWLEKEGIEYDIVTGVELHSNPDLLSHYRALLLCGHCEYWSKQMYEKVKHYHENERLWLLNFAGNTMYRLIDFYDDGSTRCVSTSFRDACADETQLFGVRYTPFGYGTCAPYRVVDPSSWVFSGLEGVRKGSLFGTQCLNQPTAITGVEFNPGRPSGNNLRGEGASGWETDKLSHAAPQDVKVVARGTNGFRSGADMVLREAKDSRGGMFSASSIVFGASMLVDRGTATVARNVINQALSS